MSDTEPLDLDAQNHVARRLRDRADAICADRDGDLNQVDELLAAETSIEALIAEVRRLREEAETERWGHMAAVGLLEDAEAEVKRLRAQYLALREAGR